MGYMVHHAILVTSWDTKRLAEAHAKADIIFGDSVSPLLKGFVNEYQTFCIAPDGSKEGWTEDEAGDERRDEFIAWLETQHYDDNSSWLSWVEVQYGDDDFNTTVTRDSDAVHRQ